MVNALSVREKINTKIFDSLGSTAVVSSVVSSSNDDYGDATVVYSEGVNMVVVPWYYIFSTQTHELFGDLDVGEIDLAIRYDQAITDGDKVTFNEKVYKVKAIEHYLLKDTLIVKALRLKENIA